MNGDKQIVPCEANYYRASWAKPSAATACTKCADGTAGITSQVTDPLVKWTYSLNSGNGAFSSNEGRVRVKESASACGEWGQQNGH